MDCLLCVVYWRVTVSIMAKKMGLSIQSPHFLICIHDRMPLYLSRCDDQSWKAMHAALCLFEVSVLISKFPPN